MSDGKEMTVGKVVFFPDEDGKIIGEVNEVGYRFRQDHTDTNTIIREEYVWRLDVVWEFEEYMQCHGHFSTYEKALAKLEELKNIKHPCHPKMREYKMERILIL